MSNANVGSIYTVYIVIVPIKYAFLLAYVISGKLFSPVVGAVAVIVSCFARHWRVCVCVRALGYHNFMPSHSFVYIQLSKLLLRKSPWIRGQCAMNRVTILSIAFHSHSLIHPHTQKKQLNFINH